LRGTTHPALATKVPKNAGKSGHGSLNTKRTRWGVGVWISFTLSFRTLAAPPR
jgi:hypothetical protein